MKYNITKKLKTAQQDTGVANFLGEIGMSPGGSRGSGNVGGSGGSGSSNVKLSTPEQTTPEQKATGSNTMGSNDKLAQIIITFTEKLQDVGGITTANANQIANSDNMKAQLQILVPIIMAILQNKARNGPEVVNVAESAATALGQTIPQGSASSQRGAQRGSLGQLRKFTQGQLYEGPPGPLNSPESFNWVGLLVGDNVPTERWDRGGNGTEVTQLDTNLPIYIALYRWRGKTVVSGPSNPPLPVGYGYNQMITLKASEFEDEQTGEPTKEGPFKAPAAVYWGPEPLKNTRSENEGQIGYYVYELSTKNTDGFGWIEVNETIITGAGLRVANVTPVAPAPAAAPAPAPAPAAAPAAAPRSGVTIENTGIDLSTPASLGATAPRPAAAPVAPAASPAPTSAPFVNTAPPFASLPSNVIESNNALNSILGPGQGRRFG